MMSGLHTQTATQLQDELIMMIIMVKSALGEQDQIKLTVRSIMKDMTYQDMKENLKFHIWANLNDKGGVSKLLKLDDSIMIVPQTKTYNMHLFIGAFEKLHLTLTYSSKLGTIPNAK